MKFSSSPSLAIDSHLMLQFEFWPRNWFVSDSVRQVCSQISLHEISGLIEMSSFSTEVKTVKHEGLSVIKNVWWKSWWLKDKIRSVHKKVSCLNMIKPSLNNFYWYSRLKLGIISLSIPKIGKHESSYKLISSAAILTLTNKSKISMRTVSNNWAHIKSNNPE